MTWKNIQVTDTVSRDIATTPFEYDVESSNPFYYLSNKILGKNVMNTDSFTITFEQNTFNYSNINKVEIFFNRKIL